MMDPASSSTDTSSTAKNSPFLVSNSFVTLRTDMCAPVICCGCCACSCRASRCCAAAGARPFCNGAVVAPFCQDGQPDSEVVRPAGVQGCLGKDTGLPGGIRAWQAVPAQEQAAERASVWLCHVGVTCDGPATFRTAVWSSDADAMGCALLTVAGAARRLLTRDGCRTGALSSPCLRCRGFTVHDGKKPAPCIAQGTWSVIQQWHLR